MPIGAELIFKGKAALGLIKNLEKRIEGALEREKEYLGLVGAIAFTDVMDHFSKSKGPERKWQKWSTAYRDHMAAIGKGGNNILIDNGRLRQSTVIAKKRLGGSLKDAILINAAQTKRGFPYAFAHDNDGPRKTLPQRKFMWLSTKAMSKISTSTIKFILK